MGKRIAPEPHTAAVNSVRKRKRVCNDNQDTKMVDTDKTPTDSRNAQLDETNSPKPVYHLRPSIINHIILEDIANKKWRVGKPIGKGNFGEIFLASDNISVPVTSENAKYVVKIEPHSNGPLFVEIHCLLNTAKNGEHPLPPGMPEFIASGSHYFGNSRYRFLVLKRFDRDLHSIIKNRRVSQKCVLTLALQIIYVLQHLHDKGYCHNDIKAQNLMISKCTLRKSQLQLFGKMENPGPNDGNDSEVASQNNNESASENSDCDSGNSSNEEEEEEEEEAYEEAEKDDEDSDVEDDDDEEYNGNEDIYKTPVNRKQRSKTIIQYSGSNPVRSCRRDKRNSIYDEMVKSHYLRPAKRISYLEFFNEDNSKDKDSNDKTCIYYLPNHTKYKNASMTKQRVKKQKPASTSAESSDDASDDEIITEERVFLIDFGLASKYIDKGVHRPFVMDQRRAHDGTLEFTSRDAHMGAHSRRSDLECLGYNLLFWSQGHLPWKDAAAQHQNERVHWIKEYLMKDVREMLKHIYGKPVPKYLGEYLQYVGQLAYHERPDYDKCRRIFEREYISLGYDLNDMRLSTEELIQTSVKVKDEIENNNVLEMKNIKSIMKNLSVIMPFHESTLSNRVSPKNLRSKSSKKKSARKKFSWTEILSQDPDQIARERAEKEFDREPSIDTPLIRYKGNPTYAILEIKNRLKLKDRIDSYVHYPDSTDDETTLSNTKTCSMKKRSTLPIINEVEPQINVNSNLSNIKAVAGAPSRSTRTKAGLKNFVNSQQTGNTSTKRRTDNSSQQPQPQLPTTTSATTTTTITEKQQRRTRRCLIKTGSTGDFTTSDESSCSSINLNGIAIPNNQAAINIKKGKASANIGGVGRRRKVNRSDRSSSTDRSSNNSSFNPCSGNDDESSNCSENAAMLFSPKQTRRAKLRMKIMNAKDDSIINLDSSIESVDVVGARRRKRSIPKKRKSSTKDDCFEDDMMGERDLRTFKKRACRG